MLHPSPPLQFAAIVPGCSTLPLQQGQGAGPGGAGLEGNEAMEVHKADCPIGSFSVIASQMKNPEVTGSLLTGSDLASSITLQ